MDFCQGKTAGWMLIGEYSEEGIEHEGFCPFLDVTQVREYPQGEGMKVHQPPVGSLEEKQYKPDELYKYNTTFLSLYHYNI